MITLRVPKTIETINIALPTIPIEDHLGVAKYFRIEPKGSFFKISTHVLPSGRIVEILTRSNTLPLKTWRTIVPQDYIYEATAHYSNGNTGECKFNKDLLWQLPCANISISTDADEYVITIDE